MLANRAGLRRWGVGHHDLPNAWARQYKLSPSGGGAYRAYRLAGLTRLPRALAARAVWATSRFSSLWTKVRQSKPDNARTGRAPDESARWRIARDGAAHLACLGMKPHLQNLQAIDPGSISWTGWGCGGAIAKRHPIAPWCCAWTKEESQIRLWIATRVTTDVWQTQHAHARLQASRHNVAVRSAGCNHWQVIGQLKRRHRSVEFPAVPQSHHECSGAGRARHPPDHGQLRHAQDAGQCGPGPAAILGTVHFTPHLSVWLNLGRAFL